MAHSAVEAPKVSSLSNTDQVINNTVSEEYNFTSLSIFQACLLVSAIALPIWVAIAFMLAR